MGIHPTRMYLRRWFTGVSKLFWIIKVALAGIIWVSTGCKIIVIKSDKIPASWQTIFTISIFNILSEPFLWCHATLSYPYLYFSYWAFKLRCTPMGYEYKMRPLIHTHYWCEKYWLRSSLTILLYYVSTMNFNWCVHGLRTHEGSSAQIQIQIPISNKYLRFAYKGLVFWTNMGADSLAENTPNAPEFVYPSPKNPDLNKKRLHWASVVHWFVCLATNLLHCKYM